MLSLSDGSTLIFAQGRKMLSEQIIAGLLDCGLTESITQPCMSGQPDVLSVIHIDLQIMPPDFPGESGS